MHGSVSDAPGHHLRDKAKHLTAIHAAPEESWAILVEAMFTPELPWTVGETEAAVKCVKALCEATPGWWEGLDRQGLIRMACEGTATAQTAMTQSGLSSPAMCTGAT